MSQSNSNPENPAILQATSDDTVKDTEKLRSSMEVSQNTANVKGKADGPVLELTRLQFVGVFVGLALSIFCYALDQTIVATALNAIISDLGGVEYVSWVGTSFLVTAAAFSPLYGKLADIFGRQAVFLVALVIFEAGSLVCALANSAITLIVGRAIQGAGGGGIFSLVLIIISDIVSFEDRGKYQGILGACFGISTVIGPILGGVFTDNATWRWCFYINLPLGAVTILSVVFLLRLPVPKESAFEKLKKIDFLGAILVVAAIGTLITPLQLGGSQWEWQSAEFIGMVAASVVLFIAFILVERYVAKDPIIPGNIFMNVSVYASFALAFCLGGAFFSTIYYVPLYFQLVHGHNATNSGLDCLPMIIGIVGISIISGQIISRVFKGNFKAFLYTCPIILTVGIGLLTMIRYEIPLPQLYGFQFVAGFGIGGLLQTRVLAVQSSVDTPKIAVVTSLSNLFQTFGGAISLAISGSLFNTDLQNNLLESKIPQNLIELTVSYPQQILNQSPPQYLPLIQRAFSNTIGTSLYSALPFSILIFFVGFLIKSYTPQSMSEEEEKLAASDEEKGHSSGSDVTMSGAKD